MAAQTKLHPVRFASTLCARYHTIGRLPPAATTTTFTKIPHPRWASTTDVSFSRESIETANKTEENSANSYVSIQKTEDGRGWGLFARQDIPKGARVFRGRALETSHDKDSHTVQIDWTKHVTMDLPAVLVNHSCQANLGIQENDLGAYDFFALQAIPEHSELLWDYETAEHEIEDFECSCGSPNCRGVLKGFQAHGDLLVQIYGRDYVAPYLLRGSNDEENGKLS